MSDAPETVQVVITATKRKGTRCTTAVLIDGKCVSERAELRTEHGSRGEKKGDIFDDLPSEPELAEILDGLLGFLPLNLMAWLEG